MRTKMTTLDLIAGGALFTMLVLSLAATRFK
jgi:hypothetical protein